MLKRLHIRNYAIIDEIVIDFSKNLNIITGETGAGKSILIGALNLILGGRFESASLLDKEKKCIVEAFFSVKENKAISQFLNEFDLDINDELSVRREVSPNSKSRSFINDTPVNLNQLKSLGALLVDLHQQFDTQELEDNGFQREVIDALADNNQLLMQYRATFSQYVKINNELIDLKRQQQSADAILDYNRFLFEELEEVNLKENELENLEAELKLLSNAENVKIQLSAVYFELNESEKPIVQQLKSISTRLNSLQEFHPGINEQAIRLQSTTVEVQDIASELERINESLQHSPERIQMVNDKISLGYKLLKKHNVNTTQQLLDIKDLLKKKLADLINLGEKIAQYEKLAIQIFTQCEELAKLISANRNKAVKPFVKNVNALLSQIGMPNAQIKVDSDKKALTINGGDEIEFLFDANKSNRFEKLSKVASGGELSRLMLCIKSLVAQKLQLPVLIFDEIDSGISGEAAKQVGIIMKSLTGSHQLISITHQPQIAARADAHYFVFKSVKGDRITTSVKLLNQEEQIIAIASMLSGERPTAAAIENAREMVSFGT